MHTAYDPEQWHDLFVATTGATAALLGLLFVAVSINLTRILEYKGLPERALEAMILLCGALVASIAGLIPGQSSVALGVEVLVLGLAIAAITSRLPILAVDENGNEPLHWKASRWSVRLATVVPLVIAGLSLIVEGGGGLYWLVASLSFAIIGAVVSAWVFLVEILR